MQLRNLSIVLGIVALGLGAAADAQAAGGSDIASAPQVTPGAENFGDTNTGHIYGDCPADYWNLPLVAGDRAIVDWQSAVDSRNYDYARTLSIYPEGTGSRIEYRRIFGTIGGIWRQCVGAPPEH